MIVGAAVLSVRPCLNGFTRVNVTELRRSQQLNGRAQFDNVFIVPVWLDYLDRPMDTVFAHVGLLSEILQSHDMAGLYIIRPRDYMTA